MNLQSIFRKRIFEKKSNVTVLGETEYIKVSFSQSGEDIIVKYIFDSLGIYKPSYIDIGAHHPYYLSNTALFYKNGCRGINIEPDPNLIINFTKLREFDINLNIGVGSDENEHDFYIISSPTLNTFSQEEANKYANEGDYRIERVEKIKVNTLKNIIDRFSNGKFPDFLNVDAEGIDEIIVREIDFAENFPKVICIETISFSTSGKGEKNESIITYLVSKGYLVYADTNINTIFVRKDIWKR